jgi:hypothetical protein
MRLMVVIMLYDFIQVLNIKRKHYTEDDYFLLIIYLLQFLYYKGRN